MSINIKPDYFIATNGLPSILNHTNRHLIKKTNQRDQMLHNRFNRRTTGIDTDHHKCIINHDKTNQMIRQNQLTCKSAKNVINLNRQIESSCNRNFNAPSLSAAPKCGNNKTECNFRSTQTILEDNKYRYQRKYDRTIFRPELSNQMILPSLPI